MSARRKPRWRRIAATLAVLIPVAAFVIYSSLDGPAFDCEVCIVFEGRANCGRVTAPAEAEGLRDAADNACALLAGGVTDRLRCTRTAPTKAKCERLG